MAVAIAKVRGRVRARLNDMDSHKPTFTGPAVDMALAEAWIMLSAQLPSPVLNVPNAFTIGEGAEVFTLPVTVTSSGYGTGTTEYTGDVRIQLATSGMYLCKMATIQFDALRGGSNPATPPLALPEFFSLTQDGSQIIRGRCWPACHPAQACNLWAQISAEDLRDYVGVGGAEGFDTVTVPGTREAVQALEAYTAGELLSRMTNDAAQAAGLDKSKAKDWNAEALDLLYAAEAKAHAAKSTGRIQRWVA